MSINNANHRSGIGLIGAVCFSVSVLTGCDQEPTPDLAEHPEFIGVWEHGEFGQDGKYVYLQISADGYLAYARSEKDGGTYICVAAERSTVDVLTDAQIRTSILWLFPMDFEINEPPTVVEDTLQMTIDGHVLRRTDSRSDGFDYTWACDDGLVREKAI